MNLGETLSFETGLPSDDTGSLEVSFSPRILSDFMEFYTDDSLNTFFTWKPKRVEHAGVYSIMIRLYDNDDDENPLSSLSVFGLEVIQGVIEI